MRLAIVLSLTLLAQATAQGPQPGVPEAFAAIQAKQWPRAAEIAGGVVARDPKNAAAWRILATAQIRLARYDDALVSLHKARRLEPKSDVTTYNTAVAYALSGRKAKAIEVLRTAKASRRVDMSAVAADDDFASLRGDAGFTALLPKPEDFTHPFVEDVKVIREWDGEHAEDQFGWIARVIGDVDGDGVPEIATSAPANGAGGVEAGRIYVYSIRSGKLLWKADGTAHDELGTGIEAAGDVNGDGIPDVIASAPGHGHAFVYSGKDGTVLLSLNGENESDDFGRHAAGVGDVDGDGHADVIVGAPGNAAGGENAGRAYVFSGKDGHLLLTLTGERAGDRFGSAVAGWSDGRHRFILVGAPKAGASHGGRTYVYDSLSTKPKFVIEADATGVALGGMFLSVIGDINGDGVPDVYASDWQNAANGRSTGRTYVHSGADGKRLLTLTGQTAGEGFGIGPAQAGDVDGDGVPDLVIGSWQYGVAAASAGRVSLFSGRDGHLLKTYTCRIPGDTFGFDAQGVGDVDGDGVLDLLVTSAWSGIHGHHSGRVFVISSGVRRPSSHDRAGVH